MEEFFSQIEEDLDSAGISTRTRFSGACVEGRRVIYKGWPAHKMPDHIKRYLQHWWRTYVLKSLIPF